MKKILFILILFSTLTINAQDRLFTYTYQSNVINKGQKEIEIWTTMSNARSNYYRGFNHRLEFEVGLGSKLQTAFYLNYGYSKGIENNNDIESVINKTSFSFANEWKLKLTDPVMNPIGSAIYFEYILGTDEIELESKLIFDKQIGKTIHALNIVGEYEFKNKFETVGNLINTEKESEVKVLFNYGFAYTLNKNLALGFELQNKNKYENETWKYSVLTAGPSFSYSISGFWINLTFMPQITNFKTGDLELIKNEKFQTRLIFSYVL